MNYTCPYCNSVTYITSPIRDKGEVAITIGSSNFEDGKVRVISYEAIACPNQSCRKLSLTVELNLRDYQGHTVENSWQLMPESSAKPQPSYIPSQLVSNYVQACRILHLAPGAAAALARRCLQGMIRDFWKVSKPTLKKEIDALEDLVSAETWSAIDAIRSVGNIGAHFEEDVNVIVDIEPDEAELLIRLIEDLFRDWYVARHEQQNRNKKLTALAEAKKKARKATQST